MVKFNIPYKKAYTVEMKLDKTWNGRVCNKVFFDISNDGGTVKLFLDAIKKNNLEDAKVYISKNFADNIDLNAVKEVFAEAEVYKHIVKNNFEKMSKMYKTNSVLIMENGISKVMHLHLIQEPDIHGNWKIFGIEKE